MACTDETAAERELDRKKEWRGWGPACLCWRVVWVSPLCSVALVFSWNRNLKASWKLTLNTPSAALFVGESGLMMPASCIKLIKVDGRHRRLCSFYPLCVDERVRYARLHLGAWRMPSCSFPPLLEGSTKDKRPWIESNRKLLPSNDL